MAMPITMGNIGLVAAVVIGIIILLGLRLVREYERAIVFTLGRYTRTSGPGVFWIFPLFENIRVVDIRTITVDIQQQETITRDSVTVQIYAVLWFRITNPRH